MSTTRKSYPSDVTDVEWEFLLPYLTLMREDAPQREYALRDLFDAMRYVVKTGCQWRYLPHDFPPWAAVYQQARRWLAAHVFEDAAHDLREMIRLAIERGPHPTAVILDGRTLQSTPESGGRAGFDGHKKKQGSKVHVAVDTLGHLLTLVTTPANEQERAQVATLAQNVQEVCGQSVQIAFVDQGYTGEDAAQAAKQHGIQAGSGQAFRGQAWLCVAAAALGRRTHLRLARTFSPLGSRLRTLGQNSRRLALARRSHTVPAKLSLKCITGSKINST